MDKIPVSLEEFRALVNNVLNMDTSDVAVSEPPAAAETAKDTGMAEEMVEEPGGAEVSPEEVPAEESMEADMTLADLAAEVGMSEEELSARLAELGLADSEEAIQAMLVAISADEQLLAQVVDVIKNAGKSGTEDEASGGIL